VLKAATYITAIMGSVLAPSLGQAAVQIPPAIVTDLHPDLHRVDLAALTDRDKRRLDFYAAKIVEEIAAISELELEGDAQAVEGTLTTTRTMADRFTVSSQELGLSAEEARQYFLVHMMGSFSGRLPDAFMGPTGIFDLNLLFVVDDSGNQRAPAAGNYVDLLRNQTVGGVTTGN
jgi:hypothetical protein